jgi:hypothetical protein
MVEQVRQLGLTHCTTLIFIHRKVFGTKEKTPQVEQRRDGPGTVMDQLREQVNARQEAEKAARRANRAAAKAAAARGASPEL